MGLFDEVVGAFLKGDAGKYQAILSWVEEQGGIQVLLEKLQSGGLGASLSTWLSNQQGNQSVSAGKYQAILSWVEEQGGIQVLLEKLQSGGLGASLSTWLSNQQGNQSVSGEQLESALGTNAVSDLGQKLGVDTSTASSLLAINRLVASNWNRRSAQMRCPILDKNLAWIPVQLPVYWQNNCRRLLMRSHRKVKCLHKPITICFPQAWNC